MDNRTLEEHGLSFVIPVFNEATMLNRLVDACHETGLDLTQRQEVCDYEIVVVDDGSSDGTSDLCDAIASTDPRFRVVHHGENLTLGKSLRSGFEASRGRFLVYTDADLPFDLGDLHKAFRLMRYYDADIVTGYRFSRAGEGIVRLVYSYAYNLLVRIRFGLMVRDVNFAAKLIRREVLDKVELHSNGSFIDAELLIRAERAGFRTIQFGIDYFPRTRGTSTLSSPKVIRQILAEMHSLAPELRGSEHRSDG